MERENRTTYTVGGSVSVRACVCEKLVLVEKSTDFSILPPSVGCANSILLDSVSGIVLIAAKTSVHAEEAFARSRGSAPVSDSCPGLVRYPTRAGWPTRISKNFARTWINFLRTAKLQPPSIRE